jgi:hypothetical protein
MKIDSGVRGVKKFCGFSICQISLLQQDSELLAEQVFFGLPGISQSFS